VSHVAAILASVLTPGHGRQRFASWCWSLAVLLVLPTALVAQSAEAGNAPRIVRVTFRGVAAVSEAELLASIQTAPSRCRGFLLRPFCMISNAGLFEQTHRLDSLEMRRDELRLRVRYFQRGYREAQVTATTEPRGGGVEVVFDVKEGPPTLMASLELQQTNQVLDSRQLRRASTPAKGSPLDLIKLDSATIRLRESLHQLGYLDATLRDTVVLDRDAHAARVQITIDPQRLSTLREVVIEGNEQISDRVIRTALDIRPGEVLRSDAVFGSQRNLYQSNLFRLARVTVPPQADSAKRLEVEVLEAPLRAFNAGAGINTVDFVQVEGGFTHYNFNGSAGLLSVQATLGNLLASQLDGSGMFADVLPSGFFAGDERAFVRPTWQASITVSQPGFRASHRNTISASVFTHRRTLPGIAIDRGYGASLSYTRKLEPRSPLSAGYRYEITTVEAGDVYYCVNYGVCETALIGSLRRDQRLSPIVFSLFSDRADRPMAPTSGFHASIDLEHASQVTFSNFRYNRAQAEYAHYFSLGRRRVLAARVRGGWVKPMASTGTALGLGADSAVLHPRKRFYAGGSRSVRGYGENQLGPRILTISPAILMDTTRSGCSSAQIANGSCDPNRVPSADFQSRPLGGRQLLEANVEYRFPLLGALDAAVFVDAGWVGSGAEPLAPGKGAITPGFGFRYESPVGPVRIDLGIRPTVTEDLAVITETADSAGVRRLVRLSTQKRFDPLEDAGGLRKFLNRLQLHLSIGQAF
jgi:outer membrane protein assembly complex protein YaeT